MIAGITVNNAHSYRRYELRLLKRTIGSPPKDDHTERVPFSSVTYDFDEIMGSSFGERTLTYQFEFLCFRRKTAAKKLMAVLDWLHWSGRKDLYDDMLPGYHFSVREPTVSHTEKHGVYLINATFKAEPEILPNAGGKNEHAPDDLNYPDVDGDGKITAADAALISDAYAKLSAGKPSGLTDEQEKAADADMDNKITAADSAMVLEFYACLQSGKYEGTPEGWAKFFNDYVKGEA